MRKVKTIVGIREIELKYTGKRKVTTSRAFTFRKNSGGYMTTIKRKCVQTTTWTEDKEHSSRPKKKGDTEVFQKKNSHEQLYTEYSSNRIWPTEEKAIADAERWMKNNPA